MPAPFPSAPLDAATRAEVERRYNVTTHADTRLRYQIVLLAHQGHTVSQIHDRPTGRTTKCRRN
jgi:hypothetical protein